MIVEIAVTGLSALPSFPESMLTPMGPVAAEQKAHLLRVIALTMIAVLPVLIGAPLLLWRYRYRQGGAQYRPGWSFNKYLECAMWGVPVAIILSLAGTMITSTRKLDPATPLGPTPLQIQAIGLNWKWLFIYPEQGVASIDALVVPVGRPVELSMTSDTVMQSLMVPALFGQNYAMPGMVTKMNFLGGLTGITTGRNWQFSGGDFPKQQFSALVVPVQQFTAWVDAGQRQMIALNADSYAVIARPGTPAEALAAVGLPSGSMIAMRQEDPALFERVVARYNGGTDRMPSGQSAGMSHANPMVAQ